jgi:O-antigen/teichoic acid export membrane protein
MSRTYPVAKLRRATVHFIGGRAVQAFARAGLVLLVVRLLPTTDYGAYMLIVGIAEMLLQLCSFGILPVGQRFLPQLVESAAARDTRRFLAVITTLQSLSLILVTGVFWLVWDDLLPYLNFSAEQIERTRPAVLLFLVVPAFRFVADLLEALLEQGKAQIARSLMPLGRMLGIGVLLAAGVEATLGRILMVDGVVTVACLALAWLLMAASLRRLEEPEQPQPLPIRAMLRHAWHMAAVEVLGSTHSPGALRMVLANSLGIVESGLFAFLQSLQRLISRYLPGVLLRGLVRPVLISRARDEGGLDLVEHGIGLLVKSNLMIVAGAAMVVAIGGDRLVALASGGKFTAAGDSLLLLFLVLLFTSQRQIVEMLLQILNLTRALRATAILLPMSLVVVWLCARYGLNAAIAASASGVVLANTLNMWQLRAQTGRFQTDWWGTGSIVLPAVVAALFGHAVRDTLGIWLAMAAAAALLTVLLVAAKPLASGELQLVGRSLGGIARRALQPFARKVTV